MDYRSRNYRNERDNVGPEELLSNLKNPPWEEITKEKGHADKFSRGLKSMKINQLRKFFDIIKNIDEKLSSGKSWEEVEGDIWTLIPNLKYAQARELCDDNFVKFVERGIQEVSRMEDRKSAFKNFSKIFESVVAYYKYNTEGKKNRRR